MKFLLKLKHWQIFLVLILTFKMNIFTNIQYSLLGLIIGNIQNLFKIDLTIIEFVSESLIEMLLYLWYYTLYQYTNKRGNPKRKKHTYNYDLLANLMFIVLFLGLISDFIPKNTTPLNSSFDFFVLGILVLATMAFLLSAIFYVNLQIVRNIIFNETGKDLNYTQLIGKVILFTIIPIGVWTFQPLINKMIEKDELEAKKGQL